MSTTVVNIRPRIDNWNVYIGRAMRNRYWILSQSPWANPFRIGPRTTREQVIQKYRAWLLGQPELLARLSEIRGKRLGCWCAPEPCHGDVLAELADREAA